MPTAKAKNAQVDQALRVIRHSFARFARPSGGGSMRSGDPTDLAANWCRLDGWPLRTRPSDPLSAVITANHRLAAAGNSSPENHVRNEKRMLQEGC